MHPLGYGYHEPRSSRNNHPKTLPQEGKKRNLTRKREMNNERISEGIQNSKDAHRFLKQATEELDFNTDGPKDEHPEKTCDIGHDCMCEVCGQTMQAPPEPMTDDRARAILFEALAWWIRNMGEKK